MSKRKGMVGERDLVHLFWSTPDWIAARIAGSGSMRYPAPDLIAGNAERKVVIESKTSKTPRIYLSHEEVEALIIFATKFRAQAWLAYKFDRHPWKFIAPAELHRTEKNHVINLKTEGIDFDTFVALGSDDS